MSVSSVLLIGAPRSSVVLLGIPRSSSTFLGAHRSSSTFLGASCWSLTQPSAEMPEYLEDPSVLTKEKLKSELLANSVELPSGNPTKDVYVQLYLQHLTAQNERRVPAAAPDPFSSDEELPPPELSGRSRSSGRVSALQHRRSLWCPRHRLVPAEFPNCSKCSCASRHTHRPLYSLSFTLHVQLTNVS